MYASCPRTVSGKEQRFERSFGSSDNIGIVITGSAPAPNVRSMKSSADLPFDPSPDDTPSGMLKK